jgi:PAS domain S-box-containing protein
VLARFLVTTSLEEIADATEKQLMGSDTRKKILLIDDDNDHLLLAKLQLEQLSTEYEIEVASSAEEGLRKLGESEFDCVISDYDMRPGMNGLELLASLKGSDLNIPFIMVTNKEINGLQSSAIKGGVDDFIPKSHGRQYIDSIASSIERAIQRRRRKPETTARIRHQLTGLTINSIDINKYFENSRDVCIIVRGDGLTIDEFNPAAQLLFGQHSHLEGTAITILIDPNDRQRLRRFLLATLMEQQAFENLTFLNEDGKVFHLKMRGILLQIKEKIYGALLQGRSV